MRIDQLSLVVALATLCATATSQDVVPASMDGVEGGGGTNIPFGSGLECRYQCLYEVGALPWTGPRALTGMRIRPDFNNGSATPAKGFLTISIRLSTSSRTVTSISSAFDQNHGVDATWVVVDRVVQLPAQPVIAPPATGPRPANIEFAFDAPWFYGLTPYTQDQPAPDSLLVEIWIKQQPNGSYRVDNLSNCSSQQASFGALDASCADNGMQVELTSGETMLAGASYTWTIGQAPPTTGVFLTLDLSNDGGLLGNPGWPLPYPMFDPANPSQPSQAFSVFGQSAPGCYMNVSPALLLGGITDASGVATISSALPAGSQYVGTTFYGQAIVLAPSANPLRMITSLGHESTVCGPLGVARIYQFYDAGNDPLPTAGNVSTGVGMVLEFF